MPASTVNVMPLVTASTRASVADSSSSSAVWATCSGTAQSKIASCDVIVSGIVERASRSPVRCWWALTRPGHHEASGAAEPCRRLPARCSSAAGADVDDAPAVHGHGAVADHRPRRVHRQHPLALDEQIDAGWPQLGRLGHHGMVRPTDHCGGSASSARRGPSVAPVLVRRRRGGRRRRCAARRPPARRRRRDLARARRSTGRRPRSLPAPRGAAVAGARRGRLPRVLLPRLDVRRRGPLRARSVGARERADPADGATCPPSTSSSATASCGCASTIRWPASRRSPPSTTRRTAGSTPASRCGGRRRRG